LKKQEGRSRIRREHLASELFAMTDTTLHHNLGCSGKLGCYDLGSAPGSCGNREKECTSLALACAGGPSQRRMKARVRWVYRRSPAVSLLGRQGRNRSEGGIGLYGVLN
jgi:hypothetical protein